MPSEACFKIIECLDRHVAWIVVCHENPDGDTLGCGMALYSLGVRLGRKVRLIGKDPLPCRYEFLRYAKDYEQVRELSPEEACGALVICVDTSTVNRSVPGLAKVLAQCADTVNIDHHGDNERYCRLNLVDSDASATAEIITDIMLAGGWGVTKDEADALYAGLITDNGNFRFRSTSPRSHICAAKLLEAGTDPAEIDDYVNENLSASGLKLWGTALSRTEIFAGGKGALFWLRDDDFKEASADASVVDGLVNMLLRINGVKIAIFLSDPNGVNKASIRTRPPYSAREIAAVFGGGGHVQAAGAAIQGTFEEALAKIRAEAERYAVYGIPAAE